MADIQLKSPIKIIESGKKPTTDNLNKGQLGIGEVNKRLGIYANIDSVNIIDLLQYDTTEADDVATVEDLGGIVKGTTAGQLKGKPICEILDALIFPVVNPTFTAPTASISFKSTSTTPNIQEVGTKGSSVPVVDSFNYNFNKGAISIAGTKKQDRAGNESSHKFQAQENSSAWSDTLPTTLSEGTVKYKVIVSYEQGPQPLDSKGNNYSTPLEAGSVESTSITVNVVYPYFANISDPTTLTKLPLTTATSVEFNCLAETDAGRHQFAIPEAYTLSKIEYFDTVANTYKPLNLSVFTESTYSQTVQNLPVQYKKYVRNEAGKSGATKFKITFTK